MRIYRTVIILLLSCTTLSCATQNQNINDQAASSEALTSREEAVGFFSSIYSFMRDTERGAYGLMYDIRDGTDSFIYDVQKDYYEDYQK
ncbi:MAG: hypothetical protein Q7U98_10695 [Methylicorpusculum sp.]|uniref:hypothetical protein n=1 Tax=Methylicorpusculum sp. TaxID=2713644 RepID=UPI0027178DAB|nr:hypothetical protein [Methylicorpusculum sp.]MDO8843764.1 hypothetical protein [Methylicorpusculum sp.]MDO8939616.1 hypothetical protein [Methylicorpusculum sp.]MDO9238716.1 hypothetical protein [Methylicorpusculum sp.]MDP2180629.1 hypothetical protein [Methylicorpusculum sp.]MDP2203670.1 hypothetical protein [Methylicorpusculum sp.]